jgi:hypothetical protein
LIISGIADIGIGLLIFNGALSVNRSQTQIFIICLAVGLFYISLGLVLALIKMKKQPK